jgi:phenylacetate-CoA ligase
VLKSDNMTEALYARLPVFLQNAACYWYGHKEAAVRLGPAFERYLQEMQESEKWSRGQICAYQDEKVRNLVSYAYHNVPFYHEQMRERRLLPQDIRGTSDLAKLPILTKEDVRANADRLLSTNARRHRLLPRHTSGTTGKCLELYVDPSAVAMQWAMWWRHRMRFGLRLGTRHVNFTGKPVVPQAQSAPPYWRWNLPMHQALINMQHLTPAKIAPIVEFLDREAFEFYSGYPSIIHALVSAAKHAGLKLHCPPRVITTGAENILANQRADIEEFTGAILTDQWGMTEACANASQCRKMVYHEDFEFGVIERQEARRVDGVIEGSLLCTGFATPDFPLIRYEPGDIGIWAAGDARCECGLESPSLLGIMGRMDDYVITPEGSRIMRFDYVFKHTVNVRECQVVQDQIGEIRLRIVRRPPYSNADERLLEAEIRKWISPTLRVRFEYVTEIERESNGKFRAVKSLLSIDRPAGRSSDVSCDGASNQRVC